MIDFMPELNAMLSRETFPSHLKTLKLEFLRIDASLHDESKVRFDGVMRFIQLISEKCRELRALHLPLLIDDSYRYRK